MRTLYILLVIAVLGGCGVSRPGVQIGHTTVRFATVEEGVALLGADDEASLGCGCDPCAAA